MSFEDFLNINALAFGTTNKPKVVVVNRLRSGFRLEQLFNTFVFTGVPSMLDGSFGGYTNNQVFFTDYINLYDLITKFYDGTLPSSISFNVKFWAQTFTMPYSIGSLVQDEVQENTSPVTQRTGWSLVGHHVYAAGSMKRLIPGEVDNNFSVVRAYLVQYDNTQILKV